MVPLWCNFRAWPSRDEITCGFFCMPTLCCTQMEQVWYSLEPRRGEYNDVTLMHLKGGSSKFQWRWFMKPLMVSPFSWQRGELMMELKMVVRQKVSTTTNIKYARWAWNFPNGQLRSVDDRLWQNYGSISLSWIIHNWDVNFDFESSGVDVWFT